LRVLRMAIERGVKRYGDVGVLSSKSGDNSCQIESDRGFGDGVLRSATQSKGDLAFNRPI
ncbi:MAG: hypothetical protein ACRDCM_01900, partial [Plesiomonas shigelloides]